MEKRVAVRYLVLLIIFAGLVGSLFILRNSFTGFAVFEQGNQTEFNLGTYENTTHSGNAVVLSGSNLTGSYTSQIFDAGSEASWNNISWLVGGYYSQELPDEQANESDIGGVNMTKNVLLLHMNEASGTIVDYSGQGNNGTQSGGVTYSVAGKLNTALSFDGGNDYVNCGNDAILGIRDYITIEAWIKPDTLSTVNQNSILSKSLSYWFFVSITGKLSFVRFNVNDPETGYGKFSSFSTDASIPTGTWSHVVATYDTLVSNEVKLYINGQLNKSTNFTNGPIDSTTNSVEIARWQTLHYFDGIIDEVAVWNRSLSENEILNIYKRGILRLNLTARSCDDSACSGESFSDISEASPQDLSLADNQYFQYKFDFQTDDSSFSPELYSVTIDYTVLNTAPSVALVSPQVGATYGYNESLALDFIVNDVDNNLDSCWYNIDRANNVAIVGCLNTTFSVGGDGSYTLDLYANDTQGEEANDSSSFSVQVGAPTIELRSPIDIYLNYQNIEFNYTPIDMDLSSCELWGDFDGSFKLNQTDTSVVSGSMNIFSLTLLDGSYLWNIRCNDSVGNSAFNGNKTFYIDTVSPSLILSEPSGSKSSRTLNVQWTVSDASLVSCLYNVYRGENIEIANTSVDCSFNNASFEVTVDANFIFNFYVNDSAGNFNSSSLSFSVSTTTIPNGGGGGGGGGWGGSVTPVVSSLNKLELTKLSNLIVDPGESKKLVLSVKNIGTNFLNECKIKGRGKNAEWLSSEEVRGLSVGEKYDFIFTLNIPEILKAGSYNIEAGLICQEYIDSISFVAEIIEKKLAIDLVGIERESKDRVRVIYSLTELSGYAQEVEVEIVLFDYNNERLAEAAEVKNVEASSKQEFENILEIPPDLTGNFNLLINAISDTSSSFLQEEVILGSSKTGGLAIFEGGNTDTFISIFLIILFVIFVIFIARRIFKLRKLSKHKAVKFEKGVNKKV